MACERFAGSTATITSCMPLPSSSTTPGRRAGHAYLERSRPLLSHIPSATTGGTQSVSEPHLAVGRHIPSDPAGRLTRSLAGPRAAVIQEVGTYHSLMVPLGGSGAIVAIPSDLQTSAGLLVLGVLILGAFLVALVWALIWGRRRR
jgi:hypothetical protein